MGWIWRYDKDGNVIEGHHAFSGELEYSFKDLEFVIPHSLLSVSLTNDMGLWSVDYWHYVGTWELVKNIYTTASDLGGVTHDHKHIYVCRENTNADRAIMQMDWDGNIIKTQIFNGGLSGGQLFFDGRYLWNTHRAAVEVIDWANGSVVNSVAAGNTINGITTDERLIIALVPTGLGFNLIYFTKTAHVVRSIVKVIMNTPIALTTDRLHLILGDS